MHPGVAWWLTSLAQSSASIDAMVARASPPPSMVGQSCNRAPFCTSSPRFANGA